MKNQNSRIFKYPYTTTHSHYVIYIYRYASEGQQLILQFCSKQHKGDPRESPASSNFWLTCWHHGHKSSSHTVHEMSDFHLLKPFCCVVRILSLLPTAHTGMLGQLSPYFFLLMLLWFHRYRRMPVIICNHLIEKIYFIIHRKQYINV